MVVAKHPRAIKRAALATVATLVTGGTGNNEKPCSLLVRENVETEIQPVGATGRCDHVRKHGMRDQELLLTHAWVPSDEGEH